MNLVKLAELQERMDGAVEERFKLETKMLPERCLGFLGELSELVDAWRRSKFWSQYREPKESTLEEYVDGLHFLLSVANKKGMDLRHIEMPTTDVEGEESYPKVRERLFDMYGFMVSLHKGMPSDYYPEFIAKYLELGLALGFSLSEIEIAYCEKSLVNLNRQQEGY